MVVRALLSQARHRQHPAAPVDAQRTSVLLRSSCVRFSRSAISSARVISRCLQRVLQGPRGGASAHRCATACARHARDKGVGFAHAACRVANPGRIPMQCSRSLAVVLDDGGQLPELLLECSVLPLALQLERLDLGQRLLFGCVRLGAGGDRGDGAGSGVRTLGCS